ncbi:M3 family metallopeptidase [Neiella marina]|uniref:M3 family metallopeptidase n=1 Tax=Neiella holothuriorum TaxID=2870530 RepID=A0ABS7EF89_9GAMM|nr:M3 family metallopeptidase [Neiella holothuriorum]MBW8190451.1 M3 family metallopeptidase [Neiella holothuriorum]
MRLTLTASLVASALAITACSEQPTQSTQQTEQPTPQMTESTPAAEMNPLMKASSLQYQAPDFTVIKTEHFEPAMREGIKQQAEEIAAIANNSAAPTFENTIIAMEKSGALLARAAGVFYNLSGTDSTEAIRELEGKMAPLLSAHDDDIYLNDALFQRVKAIYQARESLELDAESLRLVEVYYDHFVAAGAQLTEAQKTTIRALNEEHAELTNEFGQNLLKMASEGAVVFASEAELAGLGSDQLAIAAAAAKARGLDGQYVIELTNTTRHPWLASMDNRDSRQKLWQASAGRGVSGELDNRPILTRLAQIRAERAQLLGFENWASYQLNSSMAKKPEAVMDMFASMVPAVVANANKEAAAIQAMITKTGGDFELQPWDWEYYAELVRQDQYDLDEAEVQQYFEFERVLNDGVFYTMNRLFGITMKPRPDLPVYHPDVKAYEVFNEDGTSVAIFYGDYFAREGKRGGAWMNAFVPQSKLLGQKPVIVNVMNIQKAPEGQPTLVSYDNATTMFHEFGHGVHGMFSDVNYRTLAGTNVSRDFVEFPSTFQEDWAKDPQVISNYAKHYETGEPIPAELLAKVLKSRSFNQGFDTLEYMASALLDMEWHALSADAPLQDAEAFEQQALAKHGIDIAAIPPRYKSPYFAHVFAGGYSAGYYAYMWSEILAADAFAFIQEKGGLTRENGELYRKFILSVGNSRLPADSYEQLRGQQPTTEALLIRRGLTAPAS